MSKLTVKQQYWSDQLLKADAFEGSLSQYAKAQNIPAQSLYRWRHYFKRPLPLESKAPATFTQVVTAPASGFSLRLQVGQIQLQFARLPDPRWLSEFITASHAS